MPASASDFQRKSSSPLARSKASTSVNEPSPVQRTVGLPSPRTASARSPLAVTRPEFSAKVTKGASSGWAGSRLSAQASTRSCAASGDRLRLPCVCRLPLRPTPAFSASRAALPGTLLAPSSCRPSWLTTRSPPACCSLPESPAWRSVAPRSDTASWPSRQRQGFPAGADAGDASPPGGRNASTRSMRPSVSRCMRSSPPSMPKRRTATERAVRSRSRPESVTAGRRTRSRAPPRSRIASERSSADRPLRRSRASPPSSRSETAVRAPRRPSTASSRRWGSASHHQRLSDMPASST